MFPASKNYVGAFASVVSLPQGMFFEDLLFPQILDFEILMGLGYFFGYQSLDLLWVLLVFGIFMGFDRIIKL